MGFVVLEKIKARTGVLVAGGGIWMGTHIIKTLDELGGLPGGGEWGRGKKVDLNLRGVCGCWLLGQGVQGGKMTNGKEKGPGGKNQDGGGGLAQGEVAQPGNAHQDNSSYLRGMIPRVIKCVRSWEKLRRIQSQKNQG